MIMIIIGVNTIFILISSRMDIIKRRDGTFRYRHDVLLLIRLLFPTTEQFHTLKEIHIDHVILIGKWHSMLRIIIIIIRCGRYVRIRMMMMIQQEYIFIKPLWI